MSAAAATQPGEGVRVVIYQWAGKPEWKLPSVDPRCLQIHALLKFAGIPYTVEDCNDPDVSPKGELPVVAFNSTTTLTDIGKTIKLCAQMGYDLDRHLTFEKQADMKAFQNMVEDTLLPAQMKNWWSGKNVETITGLYKSKAAFPLRFIISSRYRSKMEAKAKAYHLTVEESLEKAKTVFETLSRKLGQQKFFFGDSPTSFDAIAFGVLATQLWVPVPEPTLQHYLTQHTNLVAYCDSILQTFLGEKPVYINPEPAKKYFEWKAEEEKKAAATLEEEQRDWGNRWSIFAAVAMLAAFAVNSNRYANQLFHNFFDQESEFDEEPSLESLAEKEDLEDDDLDDEDDDTDPTD